MKKNILLICLFFLISICFAQDKPEPTNQLENTEIVVEKSKKITFPVLNKVTEKANSSKNQINTLDPVKYNFVEHPLLVPNVETKIKVPAIKDAAQIKQYPHFVRLGMGNYLTTYAEGYMTSNATKPLQASIHGKHFASAFGPVAFAGNSQNNIKGEVRYAMKKNLLSFKTSYARTGFRYYGYSTRPTDNFKDTIFQAYNNLQNSISLTKIDTNSTWFYDFNCSFNYTNSKKFLISEKDILLKSTINYALDEFKKIKIDFGANLLLLSNLKSYNRSIYYVQPLFEYKVNDKLTIDAGFRLFYNQDTSKNIRNLRLYPHLDISYLISEKMKLYTVFSGGTLKNTYNSFTNENPFLSNQLTISHTNQKINATLGIKGTPFRYFYFNTYFGYQNVRNLGLYSPNRTDSARFDVSYANGSIYTASGEISFQKSEKFTLGLLAKYNGFSLDNNQKAWLRPQAEITFLANYQLSRKLSFYAETYVLAGLYSLNFVSKNERELNAIFDINLKTNYKINDRVAIYLNFYNILGSKYQRFVNYPVKSINFLGGFTISF